MRFISFLEASSYLRGKRVALVGSAPSVLENSPGFIDAHDVVVRVNNYKLSPNAGGRCDIFYSFFGGSIRKTAYELRRDGVRLCMSKVPNSKPIDSPWHERSGRTKGIDFRYIYEARKEWWFCDTFVPSDEHFYRGFEILNGHIPTTGFSAVLDILLAGPLSLYLTGFDFFTSRVHNVDESWKAGNPEDPIRHLPMDELKWIVRNAGSYPIVFDPEIERIAERMEEVWRGKRG